jgi:DNA ligase 1
MRAFAALYTALDETTKTNEKVLALARYFREAAPADAAWALHFLTGRRPKGLIAARELASWAAEAAGIPDWLLAECYHAVGDVAETIALILPAARASTPLPLHAWVDERLLALEGMPEDARRSAMLSAWSEMSERERLVSNKLITGEFRVGVSSALVLRGLEQASGIPAAVLAHRLMGGWLPSAAFWEDLLRAGSAGAGAGQPYPFCLAYPLDSDPASLGEAVEWLAEWKWDGIRAQLIRRGGSTYIWSRGEELITGSFPEIEAAGAFLPDGTVLDGEILAWKDGAPLGFASLQRRIGRKAPSARILADAPVAMLAFDILERGGEDARAQPLRWRRERLEAEVGGLAPALRISPRVEADSWDRLAQLRTQARQRGVEGLMLKRLNSPYGVGRRRGDWWKWKIEPYSVDAVLIYAQPGSGRRASLATDYTFGIWSGGRLVPFAKAYSGLSDEEIRRVDTFVRQNTIERHGPVSQVKPELVFEIAFEGIRPSTRHRSGIAVRFPRIARWRKDKRPGDADSIETVRALTGLAGA